MKRRKVLVGAAASSFACSTLGQPAVANLAVGNRTLSMIPLEGLSSIDRMWSSSWLTRNMGVFWKIAKT